ncbi:toxin 46 [Arsukibacterium tuosuense]|uniref:Toxin 46 n=1 Tax=Arsukibacterium tuosuense TaxID=1323745 RepID=A0A285JFC1_9GAMM|nr:polymorphic toxin type 46 domain-containing protein [Arsukibacterium tuosuense]SNY58972.1 toxin 46 [Arsukibacterium tuosuense]
MVLSPVNTEGTTSSHLQAREKVSRYFLEQHGFSESQIANAIGDEEAKIEGGVDLTKPLEVIHFPPPDEMTQYVKSHGFPGNWFDPTSSQTPDELGLSGEGRTLTSFRVPPGNGLQSHSKPIIDDWTNPANPVNTAGGGKQLFVNDETKKAVITLNEIGT